MGIVKDTTLEILAERRTPIKYWDLVDLVQEKTSNKNKWPNLVRDAATKDAGWMYDEKTGLHHPPKIGEEAMVDVNLAMRLPLSKVKELLG